MRAHRAGASLLLALLVLLAAGCRLDVDATAIVPAEGQPGRVVVELTFDAEATRRLDAAQVDPTAPLAAAIVDDAWTLQRSATGHGGLVVTLARAVDDVDDMVAAWRALSDGLPSDAPALVVDLEAQDVDGRVAIEGIAGVQLPSSIGLRIDGVEQGPDEHALRELATAALDARFVVQMPAEVIAHNGEHIDGTRVRWSLPVGDTRPITVESQHVDAAPRWWWIILGGIAAAALAVAGLTVRRRRVRSAG